MEPVQPNTGTRMAGTSQIETHQTAAVAKRNRQFRAVINQVLLQLFLLFVAFIVLFPVMWIVSMAVDPRGVARPTDLTLIPANATLDAFTKLLTQPFSNVLPLYFGDMLMNSLFIALGVSLFTVVLGSSAAYAFSRFRFRGREGGMLVFILLLLLPSTGLVIPLYVLFTAVPIAPGLAEFFPAFFSGVLVAGAAYIAYTVVRSYALPSPERRFNPTPAMVAGFMVVALLLVSLATWWIMFTRAPIYNEAFLTPIGQIQDEFRAAAADVTQREGSVAQRFATADRRDRNALRDEAVAQAIAALESRLAGVEDAGAIAPILQDEIAARQAQGDASSDAYLAWLLDAQPVLESDGAAAFRDNLSAAVAQFQEVASGTRSGADSARASAEEAAANLENARAQLAVAQAASDNEAQSLITERNNALLALAPYALLTWAIGLGVGALVWALTAALHGVIEPQRLIFYLLLFIMSALLVMVTYQTWEWRMGLAGTRTQSLRTTLLGLALAFAAGGFPFAIWNLKGYFDTIPKEIEEAARIDGAGRLQTFFVVMIPLSLPAFAIVILFSFMNGWTEFILSWIFLTGQTQNYTLAMALATMTGGANTAPPDMQKFAAMAILISLPILVLFFVFQKWMVSGLSLGGVKG
jgi:ABC-type maltose transport system permease subunit